MWLSSARFLVFHVLLSFVVLSLGTPIPQQAPGLPVHAVSLEAEDDPARLRRYQTYGLKQATVERVQPVSNVHPDAAPFMNVPDVSGTNANPVGQPSFHDGTIQQQQADMVSAQAPGPAPGPVPPGTELGAVPGAVPGAGPMAGPEERYSSRGDGMGGSTLSDNMVSQKTSAQGTSGISDMRGGEAEMSGPTIPTSDVSWHMATSTGAYGSHGGTNMSPPAEQAVPVGVSSAMPEGAVRNLGGNPGFPSPVRTSSHDSTSAPEQANVGSLIASTVGAPIGSIGGTSTMQQGVLEQSQGSADLPNAYTSRMVEPAAAQSGQFNGQEGTYSQYGAMVDASGMQIHPPGLGVSGANPGNIGNEAYAVRTMSDGPTSVGRLMVA